MESVAVHWLLWSALFVPSLAWLGIGRLRGRPLPAASAAGVIAWVAGSLLMISAIHYGVDLLFPAP